MSYTISVAPSGDYIIVKVVGQMTGELASQFTTESHKRGAEIGLKHFLVDVRESVNVDSDVSNYEYAHHKMPQLDIDPAARVVFLVAPSDHSHDFVETVCLNAGFNVRLFRDEKTAVRWLLQQQ